MKKLLSIPLVLSVIFIFSGFAFAQDDAVSGSITLTDSGAGPGVMGIAVSATSLVSYSGALGAGGYTGGAGSVMSCVSISLKAAPADSLFFAVRSSMDPNDNDDNGVYQLNLGGTTAPTQGDVTSYMNTNYSGSWYLRGGSS